MKFLYPQFLWALTALLIPLAVHLFNFRRYKTVYFSNTQALKNVKQRSQATKQLQKLLVLLSRLLALALLIIAFAQPYIPSATAGNESTSVVALYIDNSVSMLEEGANGPLLDEARLSTATILKSLPAATKVQIINNDFEGKQQQYYSPTDALQLLDETQVSYAQRNFSEVLGRVKALATKEEKTNVELIILSDFQKNAFDFEALENDANISFKAIKLETLTETGNVAVDSIWLENDILLSDVPQKLNVRVKQYGTKDSKGLVKVNLLLNGQLYGSNTGTFKEVESAIIDFSFLPQGANFFEGKIELDAPAPTFDNQFYFALNLSAKPKVVAIGDKETTDALAGFFDTGKFDFTAFSASNLNLQAVNNANALLLSLNQKPSSGLLSACRDNLAAGGNLVVFPSNGTDATNELLTNLGAGNLGELITGELRATRISWNDPYYRDAFLKQTERPDLPVVQKHYNTTSLSQRFVALVGFSNNQFLLGRLPLNSGQLFVSSVPLSKDFSNLQEHKVLIPTLVNAARYSAGEKVLYNYPGKPKGQTFALSNGDEKPVSMALSDASTLILQQRVMPDKVEVYNLPTGNAPGIYDALSADSLIGKIALNLNPLESDWEFYSKDNLPKNIELWSEKQSTLSAEVTARFVDNTYWKLLLGLALLFFLIEIALIKLLK